MSEKGWIRAIVSWPLSWALFRLGQAASFIGSRMAPEADWPWRLYQWAMSRSCKVQEWGPDAGPWGPPQ